MTWSPHGNHLIAGKQQNSPAKFSNAPVSGTADTFSSGGASEVDQACMAAEAAFITYAQTSDAERAAFLEAIATEIDARGDDMTRIGTTETGLPEARLEGERGRTTGQLRLFAAHIRSEQHNETRHDPALPDRTPPRPDLRLIHRPIGPVAVFGASNFPLAFSVAGGDTASALAAGCPVVIKGHPAHPGTSEIVAEAIVAAVDACGLPSGVFSLIQGDTKEVGAALVTHPLITAVGFTGSLGAGRALFDLCAARPTPIPFFGELGSINPVFVMPGALATRGTQIARDWIASLTMGAGQFCTNPGVVVLPEGGAGDAFVKVALEAAGVLAQQTMLTDGIAEAFRLGTEKIKTSAQVTTLRAEVGTDRSAAYALFETDAKTWLETKGLQDEVSGPLGVIVRVGGLENRRNIASELHGQLTCTLHVEDADLAEARQLVPVLERKAGRILFNGFPTGVEVADAMVHGGPYPASTNFGHSSVGTISIRRWLRPVCYQNLPTGLPVEKEQ